jgi:hypothetical protein
MNEDSNKIILRYSLLSKLQMFLSGVIAFFIADGAFLLLIKPSNEGLTDYLIRVVLDIGLVVFFATIGFSAFRSIFQTSVAFDSAGILWKSPGLFWGMKNELIPWNSILSVITKEGKNGREVPCFIVTTKSRNTWFESFGDRYLAMPVIRQFIPSERIVLRNR